MSKNIKMSDLTFGSLNNLQDGNSGKSGDRRRTSATTAIRMAVETAFSKDTLNNITEFNGVVVSSRPVIYASYSNKTSLFEEYLIKSPDNNTTEDKPQDYASYAYKVYIPELEPRPAPVSNNDPVLVTYPDVYSDIEDQLPRIPLGTLVAVKFEDVENLFNPRIVRKVGGPIQIQNVASEELNKKWNAGTPAPIGSLSDGSRELAPEGPRYPGSVFKPSYNWSKSSKRPQNIKWIIMHTTEIPTLEASRRVLSGYDDNKGEFMERRVSAHYVVGPQGEIYNMVADTEVAWHAGKAGDGRVTGANSIGIEVVGYSKNASTWNDQNTSAIVGLLRYLTEQYNIPIAYEGLRPGTYAGVRTEGTGEQRKLQSGIIAHSKSTLEGRRYDPGIYFPWDAIREQLEGGAGTT